MDCLVINVVFRADASIYIGSGHIMRCLVLAQTLISKWDARCVFVMKAHERHLADLVALNGIDFVLLPLELGHSFDLFNYATWVGGGAEADAVLTKDAAEVYFDSTEIDWVVVDHYGLDKSWESLFAKSGVQVAVIDDLVNRHHVADILIDQTCGRASQEYQGLIPSYTTCLTGESFSLLRPEFCMQREASLRRKRDFQVVKKVVLSFGSTDPGNVTPEVLKSLAPFFVKHDACAVVIISSTAPHLVELKSLIAKLPYPAELHIDSNNVAKLLVESDVAVGAAGSATWERCALGVPTLLIQTAENQSEVVKRVCQFGAAQAFYGSLDSAEIVDALESVVENYRAISSRACQLIDGLGSSRIVEHFKG